MDSGDRQSPRQTAQPGGRALGARENQTKVVTRLATALGPEGESVAQGVKQVGSAQQPSQFRATQGLPDAVTAQSKAVGRPQDGVTMLDLGRLTAAQSTQKHVLVGVAGQVGLADLAAIELQAGQAVIAGDAQATPT